MAEITIRRRHAIRKGQAADITKMLEKALGKDAALFPTASIERAETDADIAIYLIDKKPLLISGKDWAFPTLRGAHIRPFTARRITVDSGAVSFMVNGADVMRPGVVAVTGDIQKNQPALVVDEKHGKPLAVVIALFDADEIRSMEKGKVAKNIHYVGDPIWNLEI
ncbi:MAG: RNA-binding protein [Methanocalculus sp. MSAO_Arc1]|uniref:RNA-binding protein n=1 Tax=Methanocalculus TaxID=71151 RepID=UPI000FEDB2AC|nr:MULTISPECIES: RNA-binding protein [unclassified Methanocalculus]MCP1661443.1 PUA domain protein [Methanocalculus sp. AMF5]RQD79276.1 MAG: RNA-binding protein [Methanocalculus sp. MSAO_Arc1]